jgi:hypothetical protein
MIKYLLLSLVLNVNLSILARMIQGAQPFHINTDKIHPLETPKILLNFAHIRIIFITLMIYNSLLIATDFNIHGIFLYAIYWLPVIWWWEEFYNLRFQRALLVSSISAKISIILVVVFEPHPLFWVPSILWSIYITYLSAWFEWGSET